VQLSRITVAVDAYRHASDIFATNAVLRSYDLVAVTPGDEEVAKYVLATGAIDILHLDLTAGRLPFTFTKELAAAAATAGVALEVEYAPAIRDASCRRHFIANTLAVARTAHAAGVRLLLTSAAERELELRSPRDAAALAAMAGLPLEVALAALSTAAAAVIEHAESRIISTGGATIHRLPAPAALPPLRAGRRPSFSDADGVVRLAPQSALMGTGVERKRKDAVKASGVGGGGSGGAGGAGTVAVVSGATTTAVNDAWLTSPAARGMVVAAAPAAASGTPASAASALAGTWAVPSLSARLAGAKRARPPSVAAAAAAAAAASDSD